MNKAIIFDLDGVLIDSKKIHFNALNLALKNINDKYAISDQEQNDIFEGMTTKAKLEIITHTKGLPKELHNYIWLMKQEYSANMFKRLTIDKELVSIFKYIKANKILIGVASNSIKNTLQNCLISLGIMDYIDIALSNEDVNNPKPNPEIYNKCMTMLSVTPTNAIILEDSNIGKQAAIQSGAKLIEIESRKDITLDFITNKVVNCFE